VSSKWSKIPGRKRRTKIEGQFVSYLREMIESPSYRALSLQARKILRRLEIEHCAHGGAENGRLPCTYNDFVKYGCWREGISRALVEATALGFVQVMSIGKRSYGDIPGKASTYRLTYLPTHDSAAPTHEWRKIESAEFAKDALKKAMADYEDWLNTGAMSPRRRNQVRNELHRARNKNRSPGVNPAPIQCGIPHYRKQGS
jgi:hypothetical protein